ncbi:single-stranded-DNA-specific exonuclease RecJ [Lagierella sp.]|uniref:single-stranded-DNA-specific exonuclease RecJ n=1 Tax=Lagierella sp. TaxID=2849657 RepID=UPI002633799C|nr:single-stranded-DNA-specific exonuclease RecJ [Lagierella sp.]
MSKWLIKAANKEYRKIAQEFKINEILAKIIANRDISYEEIPGFLNPNQKNSMHDPFLMKDMDRAVELIKEGIDNNSHIRIVGDYDQDGNSATMTLMDGLLLFTENISYAIPHRVEDGYGISKRIVEEAKADNVDLIITCDNGISSLEPVKLAKDLGMKIIVTDHHQVRKNDKGNDILPSADAVLNPNREDCSYPFKYLCGAGVAFKLMYAFYLKYDGDMDYLMDLLEYVAMGTVADIVDLVDENRFFVKEGLNKIHHSSNYGLQALIREAGLKQDKINTYALGFVLGPCINAAGRLDTAVWGIELFLEENIEKIDEIAKKLVSLNEERKSLTEDGLEAVLKRIEKEKTFENDIIVVCEKSIHESLAGIIAGRVKEKYNRPTIVFTSSSEEGVLKGSGRSIEEYNMYENILPYKNLLKSFGGHPMAAGLSIYEENFELFYSSLLESSTLTKEDLIEKKYLDSQLFIDRLNFEVVEELEKLEPYGKGNPTPLFGDRRVLVEDLRIIGKNSNALRLDLSVRGRKVKGITFSSSQEIKAIYDNIVARKKHDMDCPEIDILYYPNINEYKGTKTLQVIVKDIR